MQAGLSEAHRLLQPAARAMSGWFWLEEDICPTEVRAWVDSQGGQGLEQAAQGDGRVLSLEVFKNV